MGQTCSARWVWLPYISFANPHQSHTIDTIIFWPRRQLIFWCKGELNLKYFIWWQELLLIKLVEIYHKKIKNKKITPSIIYINAPHTPYKLQLHFFTIKLSYLFLTNFILKKQTLSDCMLYSKMQLFVCIP